MTDRRRIPGGQPCPKCHHSMQRFEHAARWRPQPSQKYWFIWWDVCRPCGHTQHYEEAKRREGGRSINPKSREGRAIAAAAVSAIASIGR